MYDDALRSLKGVLGDPRDIVLLVGSGLSVRSGLPTWKDASADALRQVAALRTLPNPALSYADYLLKEGDYYALFDLLRGRLPEATYFQVITRAFGRAECQPSPEHHLLAAADIAGVLTTNFDRMIESSYTGKRRAELRLALQVESHNLNGILTNPSDYFVVKLHGDITAPETMVLTSSQCAEVAGNERILDLIADLASRRQLVVLGYGLRDPDFWKLWQSTLGKRTLIRPAVACFPEGELPTSDEEALREANIHIVRFENPKGEFGFITEVLRSFPTGSPAVRVGLTMPNTPVSATEIDDYVMLYDRLAENHSDRFTSFVAAVCLGELAEADSAAPTIPYASLHKRLRRVLSVSSDEVARPLAAALRRLTEEGLAEVAEEGVALVPGVRAGLLEAHVSLRESEQEIVGALLREVTPEIPASKTDSDGFLDLLDQVLLWCGRSFAEQVLFSRLVDGDEAEHIRAIAQDFCRQHDYDFARFDRALRRLLYHMTGVEEEWFFRKLQAHFLASSYCVHPGSERLFREFAGRHVLYLDSSVALPALAEGHPMSRTYSRLLQRSCNLGVSLRMIPEMGREVIAHLGGAIRQLEELDGPHLQQRLEAYAACTGEGHGNVFVEGYLGARRQGYVQTWRSYLAHLTRTTHGRLCPDPETVWGYLEESLGVTRDSDLLPPEAAAEAQRLEGKIQELRMERRGGGSASVMLSRSEARQFVKIHFLRQQQPSMENLIWFLTTDTHIAQLQLQLGASYPLPISYYPHRWSQYIEAIAYHEGAAADFGQLMRRVEYGAFTGLAAVAVVKKFCARLQEARLEAASGRVDELVRSLLNDYHLRQALREASVSETENLHAGELSSQALDDAVSKFVVKTDADWQTMQRSISDLQTLVEDTEREKEALRRRIKAKEHHITVLRVELRKKRK